MAGDTTVNAEGEYGTRGIESISNKPGSRTGSVSWRGKDGNFWLFGGQGIDSDSSYGSFNDLWKFSPSTNKWTWMSGDSLRSSVFQIWSAGSLVTS